MRRLCEVGEPIVLRTVLTPQQSDRLTQFQEQNGLPTRSAAMRALLDMVTVLSPAERQHENDVNMGSTVKT